MVEGRNFFHTRPAFNAFIGGGNPGRNIAIMFGAAKTRMLRW